MSSSSPSLIQPGFAIRRRACPKGLELDCGATGNDGFHACCPSSFTCPGPQYNVVCCPLGASDRSEDALAHAAQPRSANGTWDMFDNGGYFCCEHGLPGYNKSNTNGCAAPHVALPAGVVLLQTVRVGVDLATATLSSSSTPSSSQPSTSTSTPPAQSSSSTPVAAIAGGVVGGIAGLALIIFLTWFCLRRRRRQQQRSVELDVPPQMEHHGELHAQKYAMVAQDGEIHEVGELGARTPDAELAAPQRLVELDGTSRVK